MQKNKVLIINNIAYSFVQKTGAAQTFTTVVWTRINFDTVSNEDGIIFNNTLNEWTIPNDGMYHINAGMVWVANATGSRGCRIVVNGVPVYGMVRPVSSVAGGGNSADIAGNFPLFSGDLVAIECFHNIGANLNSSTMGYMPCACITRIGDL